MHQFYFVLLSLLEVVSIVERDVVPEAFPARSVSLLKTDKVAKDADGRASGAKLRDWWDYLHGFFDEDIWSHFEFPPAGKVVGAMIGVIGLAIATEAISKFRHSLSEKAKTAGVEESKKLSMIQTALHGVHAFTGYILMLATMTYSLELLFSFLPLYI